MIKQTELWEKKENFLWEWKQLNFVHWLMAHEADGSIIIWLEDTNLLVTAVLNKEPDPDKDFTPLMVDFRETFSAWWKIGWWPFKRKEWRPSDQSIVYSRLIDRSIRPMLVEWMVNDLIITLTSLSVDKVNPPAVIWIIWASLSLSLAGVPFTWPIWAVQIAYLNWKYIINPSYEQIKSSDFEILIAGTKDAITMIEASWKDAPLDVVVKAIEIWQEEIKRVCKFQEEFLEDFKIKQQSITVKLPTEKLINKVKSYITLDKLNKFLWTNKKQFKDLYSQYEKQLLEKFQDQIENEESDITEVLVKKAFFKVVKEFIRYKTLVEWIRIDWRSYNQIRPLFAKVKVFDRNHGSAIFQRWETQAFSTTTLWAPGDYLVLDTMEYTEEEVRFMHHYYMLPYATNEARPYRWQWRREIWHWRLAEKTLETVVPSEKEFPYVIRVVSEITSSNGSSSMASVCAWCLSLMDAWVPIRKPVSWIAMGLMIDKISSPNKDTSFLEDWRTYAILTDIQWVEDFTGDMDFKVAWTAGKINALQMDIKVKWLPIKLLQEALEQGIKAKDQILDYMLTVIDKPRQSLNPYAPRIISFKTEPSLIKDIIWPGGANIQDIIKQTKVSIDIKEDWTVLITSTDKKLWEKALKLIKDSVWIPKVWDIIEWEIQRVEKYWLFVKIWKKVWLCHVSNISKWFVQDPNLLFKVWDKIKVQIIGIDNEGKIQLKRVD